MATLSKHHQVLVDGVGKCSRPMWMGGLPAGFCDVPAYGRQEVGQMRSGDWERGRWYPTYCGGLACYAHGGPKAPEKEPEPHDEECDCNDCVDRKAGHYDTNGKE